MQNCFIIKQTLKQEYSKMKTLHIETSLEMIAVKQILKDNGIKLINGNHGLILVETLKTAREVQNLILDYVLGKETFCLVNEL